MHLLALRISNFLSLKPDAVLKHWASSKILRSKASVAGSGKDTELDGDEEICKLIVQKFEELGGGNVSYADIAKRAWESGRLGLATKVRVSNQDFPHLCVMRLHTVARLRSASIGPGSSPPHDEGR